MNLIKTFSWILKYFLLTIYLSILLNKIGITKRYKNNISRIKSTNLDFSHLQDLVITNLIQLKY